jgi:hypothetical protein
MPGDPDLNLSTDFNMTIRKRMRYIDNSSEDDNASVCRWFAIEAR